MPGFHRRSATRVRGGLTQKKNNWDRSPGHPDVLDPAAIAVERRGPGPGARHLLSVGQVRAFLPLLPDWHEAAAGLRWLVLDGFWGDAMGWYSPRVVALCAWEADLWWEDGVPAWIDEHREVLDLLEVDRRPRGEDVEVRWTEDQARAFLLLHVLPHELGHHHDAMTNRSRRVARGEPYAEAYARRVLDEVWPAYAATFGVPGA
jgi:hypothetical protein